MSSPDAISLLRSLSDIIANSVNNIEQTCNKENLQFPSPDEPFTPTSHAAHMNPQIIEAASLIVAAASQITAVVRPAPVSILTNALHSHVPAALRTIILTNTVEILREAGPQGLHVQDIAAKNGTHPGKLGRILRLLATEHIFKEVAPDVFANNRISSTLDTYKSVAEIETNPQDKHAGTSGVPATVLHCTDEAFKSSAYMGEAFTNPEYALSEDPAKAAFSLAFNAKLSLWDWFDLPENEINRCVFGFAMKGGSNMFNPRAVLEGFDWTTIPNGTVVDVGGGVGSQSLIVAKEYSNINFIIQDRPAVLADAKKFWTESMPEALDSGRVTFQEHDFFREQPVKGADIYYLRMILHDWADSYCLQILKRLRDAAGSNSRLIITENLMLYACEDTTIAKDIPGGTGLIPPKPLLPNWGHANTSYGVDVQVMSLINGVERTLAQFDELLQ